MVLSFIVSGRPPAGGNRKHANNSAQCPQMQDQGQKQIDKRRAAATILIVKAPFSACVDIDKPGGYANLMNCCKDSVSDVAPAASVQVPHGGTLRGVPGSGTLPGVALP
ncbi:hypothetical protein [Tardiphaga sp.]|uniref:hypothetical protein n=1 Tax=Tardiphaga sp. TaxID=1926292 RepID=UPI00352BAC15